MYFIIKLLILLKLLIIIYDFILTFNLNFNNQYIKLLLCCIDNFKNNVKIVKDL